MWNYLRVANSGFSLSFDLADLRDTLKFIVSDVEEVTGGVDTLDIVDLDQISKVAEHLFMSFCLGFERFGRFYQKVIKSFYVFHPSFHFLKET